MATCFVKPVREVISGVRVLTPTDGEYDYEYKRGMKCDPKAPACRHWCRKGDGQKFEFITGKEKSTCCCENCYFFREKE